MARRMLSCLVKGALAGQLVQDEAGLISFVYSPTYAGPPLSLSLPVSNRIFRQREVVPYLLGLLPDNDTVRKEMALEFGVSPNNPVALLANMGLDCPGAVQFCAPEEIDEVRAREGELRPLSDAQIAQRLRSLRADSSESWLSEDEHWSLGGNQGKFALALHDGRWCSCEGSAPTTHIFKPGVRGFRLQALNEFVCMRLADACGIPAAPVDYRLFEDEPAIIVSRYDRVSDARGHVIRLHQEDFCQALGVPPAQKYTADGGPAVADCVALLARTADARINLVAFTRMLLFNCLIGAPDAHAKNYSLLLGPGRGEALLAPMYDVASGLAYEGMRRKGRLAMAVGGENRFGRVGRGAVERYAGLPGMAENGIDAAVCLGIMHELAEVVPDRLAGVFDDSVGLPGITELREHLEKHIAETCADTLRQL